MTFFNTIYASILYNAARSETFLKSCSNTITEQIINRVMLTQKKVKTAILLYYHRKTGVLHAFVVYNLLALELISENHLY